MKLGLSAPPLSTKQTKQQAPPAPSTLPTPTTTQTQTPAPTTEPTTAATTTTLHPFDDSYENHEPRPLKATTVSDKVLDKIAPVRTHERVIHDIGGSFFGISVGLTLSQLDLVKKNTHGVEVIQVVNPDGSSNVETVLGRLHLHHNHRIELQGPALNTSLTPGDLPIGARFIGLGLTSDVTSAMDHDALSYTVEVKLTEKSVLELAALGGAGAAALAADALKEVAGNGVGAVVGDIVCGAVPVLSAVMAAASARRAWHVCHDPTASKEMKAFAVAHAVGDTVRVFAPVVGTLMNAGLVGVAAFMGWVHMRHTKHAAPTGPPDADGPSP